MAILIEQPTVVEAAGNKPKEIEEYIGIVNSHTDQLSIARMRSPEGWLEPGQSPEFDEYSVVLRGMLQVTTKTRAYKVQSGQAIIVKAGEWVQYATPEEGGAEYISVCFPAFNPDTVHRDDEG